MMSIDLAPDKISSYINTFDIQNFSAVKIINFLRDIPEFAQLDERDRLILVKYNLQLLSVIRNGLTFDQTREIVYEELMDRCVPPNEEAFAHQCKSLFTLCYGYDFVRTYLSVLHAIANLVEHDSTIVQLLMMTMIFLKGLSGNVEQEPSLNDGHSVFHAQSTYTDLLFRYLIDKSSFNDAVIKMMRIVEILIKIQKVTRDFQENIRTKVDVNYLNPLMRSLLHFT